MQLASFTRLFNYASLYSSVLYHAFTVHFYTLLCFYNNKLGKAKAAASSSGCDSLYRIEFVSECSFAPARDISRVSVVTRPSEQVQLLSLLLRLVPEARG